MRPDLLRTGGRRAGAQLGAMAAQRGSSRHPARALAIRASTALRPQRTSDSVSVVAAASCSARRVLASRAGCVQGISRPAQPLVPIASCRLSRAVLCTAPVATRKPGTRRRRALPARTVLLGDSAIARQDATAVAPSCAPQSVTVCVTRASTALQARQAPRSTPARRARTGRAPASATNRARALVLLATTAHQRR